MAGPLDPASINQPLTPVTLPQQLSVAEATPEGIDRTLPVAELTSPSLKRDPEGASPRTSTSSYTFGERLLQKSGGSLFLGKM